MNDKHSPHFLARESDGSVRLRMRFSGEEASLFEEAAGDTPIMRWMHRALKEAAQREVLQQSTSSELDDFWLTADEKIQADFIARIRALPPLTDEQLDALGDVLAWIELEPGQ